VIDRLLEFLDVDAPTKRSGKLLSDLLGPQLDDIIDRFYTSVQQFDINPHVTDRAIGALKISQKQHWVELFNSQFDEGYLRNVRRIAVRHRDIDLDPMWYIAGYMRIKLAFIEVIIRSAFPVEVKGQLIKTLDKYIAIDMALALGTYDTVVLD
jgi:methyl-accepting chemotaxis protein